MITEVEDGRRETSDSRALVNRQWNYKKGDVSVPTVKESVTKRKRPAKPAQGSESQDSATVSERLTSASSCVPEQCEPAKKRTQKTLSLSSSSTKSKRQGASTRVAEPSEPTEEVIKKRARKAVSKKERQALVNCINKVDLSLLSDVVRVKLGEQCLEDHLQTFR